MTNLLMDRMRAAGSEDPRKAHWHTSKAWKRVKMCDEKKTFCHTSVQAIHKQAQQQSTQSHFQSSCTSSPRHYKVAVQRTREHSRLPKHARWKEHERHQPNCHNYKKHERVHRQFRISQKKVHQGYHGTDGKTATARAHWGPGTMVGVSGTEPAPRPI